MTRTLTADEIGAELRRNPPLERLVELQRACQPARDAVRARLAAINQSASPHVFPHGDARQQAIAKGVDAVLELDREGERLKAELTILDGGLETLIVEAMEARRAADARAAAPAARRKLPAAIRRADEALTQLDQALAALVELVVPLAKIAGLRGETFPLEDAELVALIQLRDRVWAPRNPPTLYPPNGSDVLSAISDLGIDPASLAGLPPSQQRQVIEEKLSRVTHPLGREGLRARIFGRGCFLNSALGLWKVEGWPAVTTITARSPRDLAPH